MKSLIVLVCAAFSLKAQATYYVGASINQSQLVSTEFDFGTDRVLGLIAGMEMGQNSSIGLSYQSKVSGSASDSTVTYGFYNVSMLLFDYAWYFSEFKKNSFFLVGYAGLLDFEKSTTRGGLTISGGNSELGVGAGIGYQWLISKKNSFYLSPELQYIRAITFDNASITSLSLKAKVLF